RTLIDRMPHAKPIEIVFTGLRSGEKLDEELFGQGEPRDRRPKHPLVSHVDVPALDRDTLPVYRRATDSPAALGWMRARATFSPVRSPAETGVAADAEHSVG